MTKEGFVFDWTKKLGFSDNPFTTDIPDDVTRLFTGYKHERRKLNMFILEQHKFGTIRGKHGYGKSMTLHWVAEQMRKHERGLVAHFDAAELKRERDLIVALTTPLLGMYERTMKRTHQKLQLGELGKFIYKKLGDDYLLILVDNIGALPQRYVSLFHYFFDKRLNVQVIAAGEPREFDEVDVHKVSEDMLDLGLDGLEEEDMVELVKRRIRYFGQHGTYPFEESMLYDLYDRCDGNPARYLELCKEQAVSLALDEEYMHEQEEKYEEENRLISISFGEAPDEEEDDIDFDVPELDEQEKLLEEIGKEQDETKERKAVSDDEDDEEKDEAQETEEMLRQLAEEFD